MKFHWGHGIALFIAFFVLFIGVLVVKSFMTTFHLEADNYYEQELAYQQRIDNTENANSLTEPLSCRLDGGSIVITYPPEHLEKGLKGTIYLFRPSDATKDQKVAINIDTTGKQKLSTSGMLKGFYKVKVEWEIEGGDKFYSENPIFVN
ncbi:FixH family protein [Flammeovirgaceae bacterium SG7u.111]|nr:FixH family protein [Flammeovirgaceae bacterium SG7u.132]WPO35619.1 FixH family protein [Flammeovirgaceae bacterium SG7u.111]